MTGIGVASPRAADAPRLAALREPSDAAAEAVGSTGTPVAADGASFSAEKELSEGNWRPLDRTGHLATVAAKRCLADGGWSPAQRPGEAVPRRGIGLCLGTMFGSLRTISEFDRRALTAGPQYAKPIDFANSVINAAAGQCAIWHGLDGVNATVAGGPSAGLAAIAWAADLIRHRRADAVLAGGAEELAPEALLGFDRAGVLTRERGKAFDARRDGFTLGEGAALLCWRARRARAVAVRRRAPRFSASGSAFDTSRGTDVARGAPPPNGPPRRLDDGRGRGRGRVAVVIAAANGSCTGDRAEALAFSAVFGARTPIVAPKGVLGETLGASGALALVIAIEALAAGIARATHGLEDYDPALPQA